LTGHDERAGAESGRKDVQVTGVDAAVGERGRAVEVVRHHGSLHGREHALEDLPLASVQL
jgi:hypothetical protein